ncbi:hypothetical protein AB1L42_18920 [Thalassoglobus sp. JC818]|uniref:hypothetical protein n=1 Tax=Thalassoglobus sp. JC818 TaxID=3232136 RepID=UPI003457BA3B
MKTTPFEKFESLLTGPQSIADQVGSSKNISTSVTLSLNEKQFSGAKKVATHQGGEWPRAFFVL